MNDRDNNAIGGMGASARPGDVPRARRVVNRGLGQLIDDAEAYQDTLREAYWSMTNDERVAPEGTRIGKSFEEAIALLGVLKGALLLCPDAPIKPVGGDYTGV